jgi:hypothetical protein
MKKKLIYLCVLIAFSVGSFCVGWIMHKPDTVEITQQVPDFSSRTPYIAITYAQCPPNVSVPDEYTCIYNLAYSTLDEADTLADKLLHTSSATNGEQMAGFYDSLHKSVQSAQKARDTYFDAVCDADTVLNYGSTGTLSEQRACMYYYADQYLNVLKGLEQALK